MKFQRRISQQPKTIWSVVWPFMFSQVISCKVCRTFLKLIQKVGVQRAFIHASNKEMTI
jgi:hypothetical protein